jgi:hypothetical protein
MLATKRQLRQLGAILLLGAAVVLASSSARADLTTCAAGAVCYYVAVQPIDVCSSTGTGCAPFNTSSKIGNPATATSTTPIGFVDATTKKDITRAILNQIGVDLAWSPIKRYNNTTFQTLHVVSCQIGTANCTSGLTSTDFMTLSQQNQISQGTAGFPNPSSPNAPVASSPNVLNMFFVSTLVPPTAGTTLYGFSWPSNNGIAISSTTFFPPFPLTPRFDNLAHEIGHNLGLDHADAFNQGAPTDDVMTNGAARLEPGSTSAAINDVTPGAPGDGSADQLNTTIAPTQTSRVALSGFLNPIANSTTAATTQGTGTIGTALIVSNTAGDLTTITAAPNSTKPDTSVRFDVSGPTSGRPGETLIGLNLTLGKGLHFDPTNQVSFLFGSNSFVTSTTYDHGNTGDVNCPIPGTQCLLIQLSGLPEGSFLFFKQGIIGAPGQVGSSGKTVTTNDIANAGASITYKFSDGLIITSTLTPVGCCELVANSQQPDPTVPAQIDPNVFQSTGFPPCTPIEGTTCPDPLMTGLSDGNPFEEPGNALPPN